MLGIQTRLGLEVQRQGLLDLGRRRGDIERADAGQLQRGRQVDRQGPWASGRPSRPGATPPLAGPGIGSGAGGASNAESVAAGVAGESRCGRPPGRAGGPAGPGLCAPRPVRTPATRSTATASAAGVSDAWSPLLGPEESPGGTYSLDRTAQEDLRCGRPHCRTDPEHEEEPPPCSIKQEPPASSRGPSTRRAALPCEKSRRPGTLAARPGSSREVGLSSPGCVRGRPGGRRRSRSRARASCAPRRGASPGPSSRPR